MSKALLNIIATSLESMGLEYAFATYNENPIRYPYFVGEYTETAVTTEDGMQETAFILNGFHRGPWLELEDAKEKIEQHFSRVSGLTVMTEDGSAVAVFYEDALVVPTGDEEFKRIQINLKAKEWKVK